MMQRDGPFPGDSIFGDNSNNHRRLGLIMAEKKNIPKQTVQEGAQTPKEKALEIALTYIEKQFGKGTVMKLGDNSVKLSVPVIPSGCPELDYALGIGGFPRGRIIEIYGPESSGKTTVALHAIAEAQRLGGLAAFIDAEHALDPTYAARLGVDVENLYVSQPDNGEQALAVCDALVRSNAIDIVVIDSVAALVPRAEIEGEMGDAHVGLQARLMSQALRKLSGNIGKAKTCVIFINQLREKIGVMYGNPETTTGGKALKFYASVRIDVRKIDIIKQGNEAIGNRTRAKIVKNKLAPPFKTVEFDLIYGEGISKEASLLDVAVRLDVVRRSGAWYSYQEDRIGQGRENARKFLKENPDVRDAIQKEVEVKMGLGEVPAPPESPVPETDDMLPPDELEGMLEDLPELTDDLSD